MPSLLKRLVERTGNEPSPNSRIAQILYRKGVDKSHELERILALPRRVLDLTLVPDLTPLYLHTEICGVRSCDLCGPGRPAKLMPLQSAILLEAERCRGALGAIPVGRGKTLASMLLVDALQLHRAVILVPSDVRDQLINVDIPRYARHFDLPIGRFTVVSYSQLSNPRTADVLERLNPDGIIPDEAHALKNKASSRTKRYNHCLKERPGIPVVPMSGTLTTKRVADYGHLSEHALRSGSPVPRGYKELCEWGDALDATKPGVEPMPPGALLSLCTGEELDAIAKNEISGTDGARAGFLRRLVQTPGVIGTTDSNVDCSLIIRKRAITTAPEVLAAIRALEKTWSLEDEEIDSAATMAAKAREMSCGFYYVWDWPNGIVDREWVDARKQWNKAVRETLAHRSRPGLDSPMLVANATMRGQLPHIAREWEAWAAVKERPQPPTKPIWISDFLMKDIEAWAAWARKSEDSNGIIWYGHGAVEAWLRANTDIPVFGAGSSAELVALAAEETRRHDVIACSVHVHRRGKNLQHLWSQNYVTYCMANGEAWEQCMGRTHRKGQPADVVTFDVALHTPAVRAAWDAALGSARYIEDTSPAGPQKLNYATKVM